MTGEHENPGADDAADAERNQAPRRQCPFQRYAIVGDEGLNLALFGLFFQNPNRFLGQDVHHDRPPPNSPACPATVRDWWGLVKPRSVRTDASRRTGTAKAQSRAA